MINWNQWGNSSLIFFFPYLFVKVLPVSKCNQTPYPCSTESIQSQWSGNTKRKTSFQWKHHQGSSTQYIYLYIFIHQCQTQTHIGSIVVSEILQNPVNTAWISVSRHANNIDLVPLQVLCLLQTFALFVFLCVVLCIFYIYITFLDYKIFSH